MARAATNVRRAVARALPAGARKRLRRMTGRVAPWEPGAELTAPPPPPGTSTGAPDFVGVGAQKAGTSWWFAMLLNHPGVYRPEGVHKELHYFSRFWNREFTDADVAAYHAWFPKPAGALTGEWTPIYMVQHWTTPLLRRSAPDAKILVLLRDPVERYQSGVTHYAKRGHVLDQRIAVEAFIRGQYAPQLRWLYAHYPREQVLVLQYERCRAEPAAELRRTLEFLGLDLDHTPDFSHRVNATRGEKVGLAEDRRRQLVELYSDEVRALVDLNCGIDPGLWPNFRHLA